MKEDEDKEEKQTFLREEIIDKKYDSQSFIEFLSTKKDENADDINNWTLDELKVLVEEFKKTNQPLSSQEIDNPQIDTGDNTNEIQLEVGDNTNELQSEIVNNTNEPQSEKENNAKETQPTNKDKGSNNDWFFLNPESEEYKDVLFDNSQRSIIEINGSEPDKSPLSKYDKVEVTVSSPKKELESYVFGLFKKASYCTFLIENKELNISKRRRNTDFDWLRRTIIRLFPGIYVPPLPPKALNPNKPEKAEKYARYLEKFMNALLSDILFKNSSLLYIFLTTEKESDFISLMKKYDQVPKPKELKYFYTRSGKITLDNYILGSYKKGKLLKIKDSISKHSILFNNLNKSLKLLCQEMKQVSNRMLEISNIFKNLHTLAINNAEKKSFINCYSNFDTLFKEMSNIQLEKITNIKLELKEYFKYVKSEYITSIKELNDKFYNTNDFYFKLVKELNNKKETLFKTGQIEKWELSAKDKNINITNKDECIKKMLPNDTKVVNDYKIYLIYYASQLETEYIRIKEYIENQHKNQLKKMFENDLEQMKKFVNFGMVNFN